MKALVVDHDRTARAAVKRLLSHVNVEVIEAENGLVALSLMETADPDFIVLEIGMPILSGPDFLAVVRQSPDRADIPVLCVTSAGTRENVHRMVGLGVADFLIKPINPVEILPRIRNLLVRVTQWRQRTNSRTANVMLMVDDDPNFLAFARPLLESGFEVLESPTSTAAAMIYKDAVTRPSVICLAEGLPMLTEDLLVDVIRRLAVDSGSRMPQFFLMSKSGELSSDQAQRFNGAMRKSFVPQSFLDEFRRVVLREQLPVDRLRELVGAGLREEVVSATQQTIGVMVGHEAEDLGIEGAALAPCDVHAELLLSDPDTGIALSVRIVSGRQEVEAIAGLAAQSAMSFDEGASELLGELANTIGGRLRSSLLSRGFDLHMGLPEIRAEAVPAEAVPDLRASFRCADGSVFGVLLETRAIEIRPMLETLTEPGSGEPAAAGAGASAPHDDALF